MCKKLYLLLAIIFFYNNSVSAQFFYNDSCRYATGLFTVKDNAKYTGTGGGADPAGSGWLRLTEDDQYKKGYVIIDGKYPSNLGLTVEFDFKIWTNNKTVNQGTTTPTYIADGFSVFLYDGSVIPSDFRIGYFGGSLGYLPFKTTDKGVGKAYLGVGIDEYGTFYSYAKQAYGSPGSRKNAITVVGSEKVSTDLAKMYPWVASTAANLGGTAGQTNSLSYNTYTSTRPTDDKYYRRLKLEITAEPNDQMRVRVSLRRAKTSNTYDELINVVVGSTFLVSRPEFLKVGFAASTGNYTAFHEVRDVIVKTPGDVGVFKEIQECAGHSGFPITTIISNALSNDINNVIVSDTLPAEFKILSVSGGIMSDSTRKVLPDGRQVYNYKVTAKAGTHMKIHWHGVLTSYPNGGKIVTGVRIDLPAGFEDEKSFDNSAHLEQQFSGLVNVTPKVVFIPANKKATLKVATGNVPQYYLWQTSSSPSGPWTNASGNNSSDTYITDVLTFNGVSNYYYRCISLWPSGCNDEVVFIINEGPDNISDANCIKPVTSKAWSIKAVDSLFIDSISIIHSPVVGNLDSDEFVEIILAGPSANNDAAGYRASSFFIYDTKTKSRKEVKTNAGHTYTHDFATARYGAIGIAKYKKGVNGYIVVSGADGYLYAYDKQGNQKWRSSAVYYSTSGTGFQAGTVNFIDFNNDGFTEVYAGGSIFDLETGVRHAQLTGLSRDNTAILAVADIDGNGTVELISGNKVYNVNINKANPSLSTITQNTKYTVTAPPSTGSQGNTIVADFNLDGKLDVLVKGQTWMYIWTPIENASTVIATTTSSENSQFGVPFVGDIDNDGFPEILYTGAGYVVAYDLDNGKANPTNPTFQGAFAQKWKLTTTDNSGFTGITLFDFNQDGYSELVYRDQTKLRIINGSGIHHITQATNTAPYNLAEFKWGSGTQGEYPVVADIDNDGQAEIIVTGIPNGDDTGVGANYINGSLKIFKSGQSEAPWAPARKVWNQYSYNVININEDLTVPKYCFNISTRFAGKNGILGDSDDKYPYNAFLQQATTLNTDGYPLFLAADAQIVSSSFTYFAQGDSLKVVVSVKNYGSAALHAPFYFTLYKSAVHISSIKYIDAHHKSILPGETAVLTMVVPNFTTWIGTTTAATKLILQINDKGEASRVQPVCQDINTWVDRNYSDLLSAVNDYVSLGMNRTGTFDVLANDKLATCTRGTIVIDTVSGTGLKNGSLVITNKNFVYTPKANYLGMDSVRYSIKCGDNYSYAWVYFKISSLPDNIITDTECITDMPSLIGFKAKEKWKNEKYRLNGFSIPLVGDLNGDGKPEVVALGLKDGQNGGLNNHQVQYVMIYNGQTGDSILRFDLTTLGYSGNGFILRTPENHNNLSHIAIADLNGDGLAEIVVTETKSGKIYALTPTDKKISSLKKFWTIEAPLHNDGIAAYNSPMPYISDLNADGVPEIIVHNKVYNGLTGNLLLTFQTLTAYTIVNQANLATVKKDYAYVGRRLNQGTENYQSVFAVNDIDNDGVMEIIAGSKIYKPNKSLTNFSIINGPDSVVISGTAYYLADGFTAVADVDGDNKLDVIVFNGFTPSSFSVITVWDPQTGAIKAALRGPSGAFQFSVPFIGDINGKEDGPIVNGKRKKLPEIGMVSGRGNIASLPVDTTLSPGLKNFTSSMTPAAQGVVLGFTYDVNETDFAKRLKVTWVMEHSDFSTQTGITMFDFDNDNVNELVYKDETTLRIITPRNKEFVKLGDTELSAIRFRQGLSSFTGLEFPVIADINGDGSADIITIALPINNPGNATGFIYAYESDREAWAPAMPVWNQGMYHPLYVNKNLTIPRLPQSMLEKYTATRGSITDTIQPYNTNLVQQPIVRQSNYVPILMIPDPLIKKISVVSVSAGKTVVKLTIENKGKASSNSNTPVTFYRNTLLVANKITTLPLGVDIFPGEVQDVLFTLPTDESKNVIYARLVDDGINFLAEKFYDCDKNNNSAYSFIVDAVDDNIAVFQKEKATIDVRVNDIAYCKILPSIITNGTKGMAVISAADSLFTYTPTDPNFLGRDSVKYSISCTVNGVTVKDTATVYISYIVKPDNIDDADCVGKAPKIEWSFKQLFESPVSTDDSSIPLVGDIDNDGNIEIVVLGEVVDKNNDIQYVNKIHIFEVLPNNTIKLQQTINTPKINRVTSPIAIAKVDGNDYAALFFCTSYYANKTTANAVADRLKLFKYVYNPTTKLYVPSWNTTYSARADREMGQPMIVDFNNDGKPEVLVLDKVFNAVTGKVLVDAGFLANNTYSFGFGGHLATIARWVTGAPTTWSSIMAVADIDGDNVPEVLAGDYAYKVEIVDTAQQSGSNKFYVHKIANKTGRTDIVDGPTSIADMDGDGKLDVVVTGNLKNGKSSLYIWNPRTGEIMNSNVINDIPISFPLGVSEHSASVPFIGDIDGDKKPEIALTCYLQTKAFDYDEVSKIISQKWFITTTDGSSATTITMFDFDQDNIQELVYRDQDSLRIINGQINGVDKVRIPCPSATGNEYPIIADVNGDGAAEIVVTSQYKVRVFGSATSNNKWAPTRKVWNQFAYNAVNVNNDLTIPRVQFNPALSLSGGNCGTVRPYNGYLVQQTTLNKFGCPLWTLPNAQMGGHPQFAYDPSRDTMTITVKVYNIGAAGLQNPFWITVYKNGNNTIKESYEYKNSIGMGDSALISFKIPNFKQKFVDASYSGITIKINDNGNGYNHQQVCDSSNREYKGTALMAIDDRVIIFQNTTNSIITPTNNDIKPCLDPKVNVIVAPKYGTATSTGSDSLIRYTPTPDYLGNDTMTYEIVCGSLKDTATIYISVIPMPDNIDNSDCIIDPKSYGWDIEQAWQSTYTEVDPARPWLVGDLDNDGKPEIVAFSTNSREASAKYFKKLVVFPGHNRDSSVIITHTMGTGYFHDYDNMCGLGIVKINKQGLIVIVGSDGYLYAYNYPNGTHAWTSSQKVIWGTVVPNEGPTISFVDFDNDGTPEVYAGNKIFNASNGLFLCDGGATNNKGLVKNGLNVATGAGNSQTVALDMDGDGKPELIAGNQIYKVTRTGAVWSMSVWKSITPPVIEGTATQIVNDGHVSVADFNDDGYPDVVVSTMQAGATKYTISLYGWDVVNDQILFKKSYANLDQYISLPFIGDIDGDNKLEIIALYDKSLRAFKMPATFGTTSLLTQFWNLTVVEVGGRTGITLFDFNLDGKKELVYRDHEKLRIIDGSVNPPKDLGQGFNSYSGTTYEYPVVVDVDNNGMAEIVCASALVNAGSSGRMHIFRSKASSPWAPARAVWNQYSYNAIHVNNDLTIPKYMLNPATTFPGKDGILGTADDVRPYNAFLQQQTILNKFGTPLWLAPNAVITGNPVFNYDATADSMTVTVKVHNIGDAAFQTPFKVTAYKNGKSGVKVTGIYNDQIMQGEVAEISFGIPKFKQTWVNTAPPFDGIYIQVNDSGNGYNDQLVCDSTSRSYKGSSVIASDDKVIAFQNTTDNIIYPTINDITCSDPKVTVIVNAKHGNAIGTGSDSLVLYTPNLNYLGNDTIIYEVSCGLLKDTATIYVSVIPKPDNINDTATCYVSPIPRPWDIRESGSIGDVSTIIPIVAGDLDGDKFPEIVGLSNIYGTDSRDILIFKGPEFKSVSKITMNRCLTLTHNAFNFGPTLAKIKTSGRPEGKPMIFVMGLGSTNSVTAIRAFSPETLTEVWSADCSQVGMIGVADFNNDGWSEVYVGNQIYDAATGKLICDGLANNKGSTRGITGNLSHSIAADIIGDNNLELIAGSQIYKVVINRVSDANINGSISVEKSVTPPTPGTKDGYTVVADFNNDGKLEVLVRSRDGVSTAPTPNNIYIYLWTPHTTTPQILAQKSDNNIVYFGIPFVGDIDGRKDASGNTRIEICYLVSDGIVRNQPNSFIAINYNGSSNVNSAFDQVWAIDHTDQSGATGMTLFDFNQDGISEIVYRDETSLRIINGSLKSHKTQKDTTVVYSLASFPVYSQTGYEYPIIVDAYNSGSSNILVTSDHSTARPFSENAKIKIFSSATPGAWAPARTVWNQYAYNVVNVNNDLTIPKYQLNPATLFPGKDGVLGTNDDIRPFNAFLQQATILDRNGVPLWLTPNSVVIGKPKYHYDVLNDSLTITIRVLNDGDAALQDSVIIGVYRDVVSTTSKKYIYKYPNKILKNEVVDITFGISAFRKNWLPFNDIIIRVNDSGKGDGKSDQLECGPIIDQKSGQVIAIDDQELVYLNTKDTLHVTINDFTTGSCVVQVIGGWSGKNGLATTTGSDTVVYYTPNNNFVGNDTVKYELICGSVRDTATIFISVRSKPDNIIDPGNCIVPDNQFDFTIKKKWGAGIGSAFRMSGAVVGDLDNDGISEIVVIADNESRINVIDGETKAIKAFITMPSISGSGGWRPMMNAVLVDADRNGLGEIIVAKSDLSIMSYEVDTVGGFKLKEKWGSPAYFVNPTANDRLPHPNVADLNGDGDAELIVYNRIYNAKTGALLGETEPIASAYVGRPALNTYNKSTNFQSIADMDGDGNLEIVAGGKVYKVVFSNDKTSVSCSILYQTNIGDGLTSVADLDLDGKLDVVISRPINNNDLWLYAWSPSKGIVIDSFKVGNQSAGFNGVSFPFIGDIDGVEDPVTKLKYPEICINTPYKVSAYKYDQTTKKYLKKWDLPTTDESGATGITLFDFNNDKINELVYRDQDSIRILNGVKDEKPSTRARFLCYSSTAYEYPSIADVDGDGSANICVTCAIGGIYNGAELQVFESASEPWASTRKVWNQTNYEPLLINNDLTTVRNPIQKNTSFNGRYPYNGALIQVPIVDEDFNPVKESPDPSITSISLEQISSSTYRVWVTIKNEGLKNTNSSLPLALYNSDPPPATADGSHIAVKNVGSIIKPGDSHTMYFDVPTTSISNNISVRIQDDGVNYPAKGSYLDCKYSNNYKGLITLVAVDDYITTGVNNSINTDILDNDLYGNCKRGTLTKFEIITNPTKGTANINYTDSTLNYVPNNNFTGIDSLQYYIKCGADSSAAWVYVLVYTPISKEYVACEGSELWVGFKSISDVNLNWYDAPVLGSSKGTNVDSIFVKKDASAVQSWWVEPIWHGQQFGRIKVDLFLSANCGQLSGCAITGTLLWREDFEGNNFNDDKISALGLLPGLNAYTYRNNETIFNSGEYTVRKNVYPNANWYNMTDHTSPDDPNRGYLLQFNGDNTKKQLYSYTISDVCEGQSLYFSAWVSSVMKTKGVDTANLMFILEDASSQRLVQYNTGSLADSDSAWKNYGFLYKVEPNQTSLTFKIFNNGTGSNGNNIVLDDISIQLCAPKPSFVNLSDTLACIGKSFRFNATYMDDGTFDQPTSDSIDWMIEFKAIGTDTWKQIIKGVSTSNKPASISVLLPGGIKASSTGHYRFVVAKVNTIDVVNNCKAISDPIFIKAITKPEIPDIRVQICPIPNRQVDLSAYIDAVDSTKLITWIRSSGPNFIGGTQTTTGTINSQDLVYKSTYTYKYQLENYCGDATSNLYIRVIDKVLNMPPDSIIICKDQDISHLHLNQIVGIDANGNFKYDNTINVDGSLGNYVKILNSPHTNAYVFDAGKAYEETSSAYVVNYKGDTKAKRFIFEYQGTNCMTKNARLVIIVTDRLMK